MNVIGVVIFIFTDFVYGISFMHWAVLGRRGSGLPVVLSFIT